MSSGGFDIERFQRAFLLLLVIGISLAFVTMIEAFLSALLLAALATGLSQPLYHWVLDRVGGRTGLASALTNGIVVEVVNGSGSTATQLFDFTDGQNIKTNENWTLLSGTDAVATPAAGDDALPIRWTLAKSGSSLYLKPGHRIRFTLQDDLTGISSMRAMVQGELSTA